MTLFISITKPLILLQMLTTLSLLYMPTHFLHKTAFFLKKLKIEKILFLFIFYNLLESVLFREFDFNFYLSMNCLFFSFLIRRLVGVLMEIENERVRVGVLKRQIDNQKEFVMGIIKEGESKEKERGEIKRENKEKVEKVIERVKIEEKNERVRNRRENVEEIKEVIKKEEIESEKGEEIEEKNEEENKKVIQPDIKKEEIKTDVKSENEEENKKIIEQVIEQETDQQTDHKKPERKVDFYVSDQPENNKSDEWDEDW